MKSFYLILTLNILLVIIVWCLLATMFTIPGEIPKYWVYIFLLINRVFI